MNTVIWGIFDGKCCAAKYSIQAPVRGAEFLAPAWAVSDLDSRFCEGVKCSSVRVGPGISGQVLTMCEPRSVVYVGSLEALGSKVQCLFCA